MQRLMPFAIRAEYVTLAIENTPVEYGPQGRQARQIYRTLGIDGFSDQRSTHVVECSVSVRG